MILKEFHLILFNITLSLIQPLAQNLIKKYDQPIPYAFKLFHHAKYNYTTIERKALAIVYAFHKFCHYLFKNKFIIYVDHMALLYLVQHLQFQGE